MTNQKIRAIGAAVLAVLWVALTLGAWFTPSEDISVSERRPLSQFPELSGNTLLSGKFMSTFEDYTLDQFPARDTFRRVKSLFHYNILRQKDNNDIYIADGYAAKLEYPLNEGGVNNALKKLTYVYETYLRDSGSTVINAVIPDKGYYLAEENGYLAMDYEKLFAMVREAMPWASHVDLTGSLDITDYYFTDTHWRQEKLLPTAQLIADALGVSAPRQEDYTATKVEKPFYGVYYGQAALPMEAEDLYIMESQLLSDCSVLSLDDTKGTVPDTLSGYEGTAVYNMEKLSSNDLYDVFLSGPQSLLRIDNPNAATNRELVVFRDSFGSSMIPLLVQDYATVTVVDLRYLPSAMVGQYVDFHGQDVLMLFSTLILNTGSALK